MKIRIFQPVVQEYRVALHEGLAKRYGENVEIWAADRRGDDISVPLRAMRTDYAHPWKRVGPFWWQRGLSLCGLLRGDVVVVCGDIHQLSSVWIAFRAKCKGVKVVWWAHHKSASASERKVCVRLRIAKALSDVMLCYTDDGVRYLIDHGFSPDRVFATGNTMDLEAVERATKAWDGVRKFGDRKTLLFCGVLRDKVRVDVLLRALARLRDKRRDFHCVIIGGGEKFEEWQKLAHEIALGELVTWVGELRGQDKLASWFLSSDLFVYPGRIGLSIIHAFAFGLPVLLNDNANNHGPEYTIFRPGENGWAFHENNVDDLAAKIAVALDDPDAMAKGERGRQFVLENYSMERMVARFSEALESARRLG